MHKKIGLALLITGALLGHPDTDARAEVSIHIGLGVPQHALFVLDTRPRFVPLPDMGFSVSAGSPYDIIFYGNTYYAFQNGIWYGSGDYRGPWVVLHETRLPAGIRRYRWEEIRRSRDVEYRRHDRRYDGRYDWRDNRHQRVDAYNRDNGNRIDRFDNPGNNRDNNSGDRPNDNSVRRNQTDNRREEGGRRN